MASVIGLTLDEDGGQDDEVDGNRLGGLRRIVTWVLGGVCVDQQRRPAGCGIGGSPASNLVYRSQQAGEAPM